MADTLLEAVGNVIGEFGKLAANTIELKAKAYDALLIAHGAAMKARQELEAEVDRLEKANVILQSRLDAALHTIEVHNDH